MPLRLVKQDCRCPMGCRGYVSGTLLSLDCSLLLSLSRNFFCNSETTGETAACL